MDEQQIQDIVKPHLDKAEQMGFDRGVKTIFTELLKEMEENKMLAISYNSIKKLYERYSEINKS